MRIDYSILDPSGNKTIIVETLVGRDDHKKVADILMQRHEDVEQVGFLEEAADGHDIRLQMAGGEFCGNATMCAAAVYLKNTGRDKGNVRIAVSGSDEILDVILDNAGGDWKGTAEMPIPNSVWLRILPDEDGKDVSVPVVHFKGISHAIVSWNLDYKDAERLIDTWCDMLEVDSLGILLFDEENSKLVPLVYVKKSDTLFWEHSCASGTAAVGVWLAVDKNENVSLSLKQPGGEIGVEARYKDESMESLMINGKVRLVSSHMIDIDL